MPTVSTNRDTTYGITDDYVALNITSTGSIATGAPAAIQVEDAAHVIIINNGLVNGDTLFENGSDYGRVTNGASGIMSGQNALLFIGSNESVQNAGIISGEDSGVFLEASSSRVYNTGSIDGGTGVAIVGAVSGDTIENHGTISGGYASISENDVSSNLTILNYGTLSGDVSLPGSNTVLRNAGAIEGDVTFGTGRNSFDGRGGTVDGTIMGGSDADTIRAGNDGETIAGGAGHDVLYAGKGEDIFIFASYASADNDVIHKFSATDDAIELASSVFTKLKAGMTPEFAIGTQASSATDHLFYDSNTGNLYYDTNGNASGGAHLIATLDPHLALTAANFIVS